MSTRDGPRQRAVMDSASSPVRDRRISTLLVLAGLVALGPLATDAYVPVLPGLATDLGTTASSAQLSVTSCLVGLAVGQLFAGPLSDAWGRRPPMLAGLVVYTLASLACALTTSVEQLVAARLVQGLGGAFALVVAYAAVRDRYQGQAAARYFSMLMLVTGVAPIAAPLAGGALAVTGGWRATFVALAALSGLLLLAALGGVTESHPRADRRRAGLTAYRTLAGDVRFLGFAAVNALVFASMFSYIAGSPFVLQDLYGLSPQQYSFVFASNALGLVAAAQVSGWLVQHIPAQRLLLMGVGACLFGASALCVLVLTGAAALWSVLLSLFCVVTSVGLVLPNATALALDDHGDHAGAAAAIVGFGQFFLGGLVAPLAGLGGATVLPMAVTMAVLGVLALFALLVAQRIRGQIDRRSGAPHASRA